MTRIWIDGLDYQTVFCELRETAGPSAALPPDVLWNLVTLMGFTRVLR
jgi:hypothetical protein